MTVQGDNVVIVTLPFNKFYLIVLAHDFTQKDTFFVVTLLQNTHARAGVVHEYECVCVKCYVVCVGEGPLIVLIFDDDS